jgi:YggT family protein
VAIVCQLLNLYLLAILVRIFMSWIPPTPGTTYASIYSFFFNITEPVLGPVRRAMPPVRMGAMGLDLSPIVVLLGGRILISVICG